MYIHIINTDAIDIAIAIAIGSAAGLRHPLHCRSTCRLPENRPYLPSVGLAGCQHMMQKATNTCSTEQMYPIGNRE